MTAPAYPLSLTNKDWQRKKGLAVKNVKTGVGAGLDGFKQAYERSAFNTRVADAVGKSTKDPLTLTQTLGSIDQGFRQASVHLHAIAKTVDATISKAVVAVAPKSKTLRAHLQQMQKDIKAFLLAVDAHPATFRASVKRTYLSNIDQTIFGRNFLREASESVKKIKTYGDDIRSCDTVDAVHDIFKAGGGSGRMLTTCCKLWDQAVHKDAPALAQKHYSQKAMEQVFTLPWIARLGNENMGDASKKLQKLVTELGSEDAALKQFRTEALASWHQARDGFVKAYASAAAEMRQLIKAI